MVLILLLMVCYDVLTALLCMICQDFANPGCDAIGGGIVF